MIQFSKSNIEPEWQDLVDEFPHIILDPSPEVLELWEKYKDEKYSGFPNDKEDLCNLRYSFECGIHWKGIIRDFFLEIDALMEEAEVNGDDFKYYPFILKEKFDTCRDQGSTFGKDKQKYNEKYREISERLYTRSIDIKG